MRHKGNRNEFKDLQDNEIMQAYRRIFYKYGGTVGVKRLYEMISSEPASRFFVSDLQATRVIAKMYAGHNLSNMRGTRRRMYEEIYRRVVDLINKNPGMTICKAVSEVVSQPAPEMYIGVRQISYIIDKRKKRCYEERKRRLRHCF